MRQKKVRITAEELIEFFQEKPVFDKSETDASIKYGWASTRGGLYSISDIYKYFVEKGYDKDAVTDVMDDFFQKQTSFTRKEMLEKGKTHNIYLLSVMNHNPEYKQSFIYYCYDITQEEAFKLKKEYEDESLQLMSVQIERRKLAKKQNQISKPKQEPKQIKIKQDINKDGIEEVVEEVVEKKERKQRTTKPPKVKPVKIVFIDPVLPTLTIES
jgi:hypothetical protein